MLRKIIKLVSRLTIALVGLVLLVALALPWLVYWQGISNFKTTPEFSRLHTLTPAQSAVVLAEFKLKEMPAVTPQNPYTKLLQFYRAAQNNDWRQSPEARTEQLVWWVASCHARDNLLNTRTMMWHISGYAMMLWLHNNANIEQILAKAWTCLIRNRDFAARHSALIATDQPMSEPP